MKKPTPTPSSPPSAPVPDEPLAEIEEMISRTSVLRDRERDQGYAALTTRQSNG